MVVVKRLVALNQLPPPLERSRVVVPGQQLKRLVNYGLSRLQACQSKANKIVPCEFLYLK